MLSGVGQAQGARPCSQSRGSRCASRPWEAGRPGASDAPASDCPHQPCEPGVGQAHHGDQGARDRRTGTVPVLLRAHRRGRGPRCGQVHQDRPGFGRRARGHTGQKGGLGFHVIKRLPHRGPRCKAARALSWSNGGAVSGAPHRGRWRGYSRVGQDNPLVAMRSRTGQTVGSDSVSTTGHRGVTAAACAVRPRCVLCNPLGKLAGQAMEQALHVRLG